MNNSLPKQHPNEHLIGHLVPTLEWLIIHWAIGVAFTKITNNDFKYSIYIYPSPNQLLEFISNQFNTHREKEKKTNSLKVTIT